jgi:uncharacterized phage infection (PIP) family protein YhgE
LALALVAGACSAWWLAFIGLSLYVVMVVIVARDPYLKISQTIEDREPLAQRYQKQFNQIVHVQFSIFNTINNARPEFRRIMRPIRTSTDELVDYAHNICQRMTVLENHRLVSESTTQLQTDVTELEFKLEDAKDPLVRREYEESLEAAQNRLKSLVDVERQLKRTDAQLHNLTSQLKNTLTNIISLKAMDLEQAKMQVPEVLSQLNQQMDELRLFSQEVRQI